MILLVLTVPQIISHHLAHYLHSSPCDTSQTANNIKREILLIYKVPLGVTTTAGSTAVTDSINPVELLLQLTLTVITW